MKTAVRTALAVALTTSGATLASAREPGIAPMIPPGLTLGLPIAVNPKPGFYFTSRTSYYDATLYDAEGNYGGQKSGVFADSLQLTWVPGVEFLGGSYKTFVTLPIVHVNQSRESPFAPSSLWGNTSDLGIGNPKVQLVDLSWKVGDGFFVGAGFGVYAPLGNWDRDAPINTGGNFWTFEPSLGFTYLKDGWNASLHVLYDTNTENRDNSYISGDQIFVNATLTKNIEGFNIGPVAYYQKQVTSDRNNGGLATFGGRTFDEPEQFALGATISKQFGPTNVQLMYTKDVFVNNTNGGSKFWLNLSWKLD